MNIILKRAALSLVVLASLLATKATAQIQLGLSGNHYSSLEEGAKFSDGLWGGGATGRYFITPKFAVGLNARYFTRSESGVSVSIIPITAQGEFFFTEGKVRPYLGVEAGIYIARAKISFAGVSESDSDSRIGVAPKAGIQFMFTEKIGIDINAGYHLIIPKDGEEVGKTLVLGAGLVFNLGGN